MINSKITIIGSGMMGVALAFPARENGNEVNLVGTPLDREAPEEQVGDVEACPKVGTIGLFQFRL